MMLNHNKKFLNIQAIFYYIISFSTYIIFNLLYFEVINSFVIYFCVYNKPSIILVFLYLLILYNKINKVINICYIIANKHFFII